MAFIIALLLSISLHSGDRTVVTESDGDDLRVVDFEGLQDYLGQFEDQTVVVNFWATWCVPCVKELPYFEKITEKYDRDKVAVVLVSLDFSHQVERRLKPFLEERGLKSDVLLLDDPDANAWINKVSPTWSGAIPATLIRNGAKEVFYEKSFHSLNELETIIQPFLNS